MTKILPRSSSIHQNLFVGKLVEQTEKNKLKFSVVLEKNVQFEFGNSNKICQTNILIIFWYA